VDAIVSIEDVRFYNHWGIDPRAIARALWTDLKEREFAQGGSTLTQQLVKNFYLTQERTLYRKATEAVMAVILDARYSKDEILETYLNEIYLGRRGDMGVYRVGEASIFYFGKDVERLTPASPPSGRDDSLARACNPQTDPTARPGGIGDPSHGGAGEDRRRRRPRSLTDRCRRAQGAHCGTRPYVADVVREQLERLYSRDVLTSEGLRIFTSLDVEKQRAAEEALRAGLAGLDRRLPKGPEPVQGGVIVMQPQTGHILALIGGRDYGETQFNRMIQARRQPGSLFKPIAYLAALRKDAETGAPRYTPVSVVEDVPVTVMANGQPWTPQTYDKVYHGGIAAHRARIPFLPRRSASPGDGVERIIGIARALGLTPPPGAVAGARHVGGHPGLAGAYAVLANFGQDGALDDQGGHGPGRPSPDPQGDRGRTGRLVRGGVPDHVAPAGRGRAWHRSRRARAGF
jgi:penicillin-binding protein 1B